MASHSHFASFVRWETRFRFSKKHRLTNVRVTATDSFERLFNNHIRKFRVVITAISQLNSTDMSNVMNSSLDPNCGRDARGSCPIYASFVFWQNSSRSLLKEMLTRIPLDTV